jgi:transcriptional regulator with XRE-family HTH domain
MHPGGRPAKHPRSGFGNRLARLREEAGLSQAQLAAKLGVTQQAIAHWERRSAAVHSDTLSKLAAALSVTGDALLGTKTKRPAAAPMGRARSAFEKVSNLPRRQQDKIIAVVEAFVAQNGTEKAG